MALSIYQDLNGRRYWAESTSRTTARNLASGEWVLFDDTPDTAPPPGDPFDLEMAERFDDPASASSVRLRADFESPLLIERSGASAQFMQLLDAGQSAALQVLGDSTGDEASEWVYLVTQWLAARYPGHTVNYRLWNDTAQDYDPAVVVQTGSGGTRYANFPGSLAVLNVSHLASQVITGDIDVRARIAATDWTPAAEQIIVSKFAGAGNRGWYLAIGAGGNLVLSWSNDGTATKVATSTALPAVADGAPLWVRATLDVDNGASGYTATFDTSTDGVTWAALGSPVTAAGVTSIFASTYDVQVGVRTGSVSQFAGQIYRVEARNGINGPHAIPITVDAYAVSGTATIVGAPVLHVINGSKGGAGVSYLNDVTRLPLLTPRYEQSLTLLSISHNESGRVGTTELVLWDSWLSSLRTRLPLSEFVVIGQNPRYAPAPNIREHAMRVGQLLGWARRNGLGSVNVYKAFTDAVASGTAASSLIGSDGVHPLALGHSSVWAPTVQAALHRRA